MPHRSRLETAAAAGAHVWVVGPSPSARAALLAQLLSALPQVTRTKAGVVDPAGLLGAAARAGDPSVAGDLAEALRGLRRDGSRAAVVVEPPPTVYPPLFSLSELGVQVLSSLPGESPEEAFSGFLDRVVASFGLPRHLVLRTFDGTHHVVAQVDAANEVQGLWRAFGSSGELRLSAT